MRRIWKIFRVFIIPFLATATLVQSAGFDYTTGYLPKVLISFLGPGGVTDGRCGASAADTAPILITAKDYSQMDSICDKLAGASKPCPTKIFGICTNGCFSGNNADKASQINKQKCKDHFRTAISQLHSECDYITAYRVGLNITIGTFESGIEHATDVCNDGTTCDSGCTPPSHAAPTCVEKAYTLRFDVNRGEPGCVNHDPSLKYQQCPTCYEDRGQYNDNQYTNDGGNRSANSKRDMTRTTLGDALAAGGWIRSQGCLEIASKTSLGDVGFHPSLSDVVNPSQSFSISNAINIVFPSCLMNPMSTGAEFDKFENFNIAASRQKQDVYNSIDATYNNIVTPNTKIYIYKNNATGDLTSSSTTMGAGFTLIGTMPGATGLTNPYKGNCGRGKFFYRDIAPTDSNVASQVPVDPNMRISSNDIWESKTGCYNPEERFVVFPAGQANYDVTQDSSYDSGLQYHEPNTVFGLGNLTGAAAAEVALDKRAKAKITKVLDLSTTNPWSDTAEPWDEYLVCDKDTTGNCIDTSKPPSKLIPNDRLLMRHPMCFQSYSSTISSLDPTVAGPEIAEAYVKRFKEFNNLFTPGDTARIEEYGSKPVCVGDDRLDERFSFCGHYLERTNTSFKAAGLDLPINVQENYSTPTYVFDYTNYCWTKAAKAKYFDFDPYEHWMPLAIKVDAVSGSAPAATTPRKDIFGNTHTYTITDYKRPTFTKYAERQIADLGGGPFDHALTSLEEYGYDQTPIARTDYAYNERNIYAPDATKPLTRLDVDKIEKKGRKAKMQECLGLFIEKYAFEGDKGAIVLDSDQEVMSQVTKGVTPDASMCQWVAYYDTSDNYGDSDGNTVNPGEWTQRNLFKATMLYYFNNVQTQNQRYRKVIKDKNGKDPESYSLGFPLSSFTIPLLNIKIPVMGISSSYNSKAAGLPTAFPGQDPERLDPNSVNDQNTLLDTTIFGKGPNNMKNEGFRRRRGLRPEIFDYYNFLSFSALGVAPENLDITNATKPGDGNPMPNVNIDFSTDPLVPKLMSLQDLNGPLVVGSAAEPFVDNDGDGKYSSGDTFTDVNANGKWDDSTVPMPAQIADIAKPLAAAIGSIKTGLNENLYTPTISSDGKIPAITDFAQSQGWQANLERRNCNSVVPPHFWKDVIKPFETCDFNRGARMVNSLAFSLAPEGADNNPLAALAQGAIAALLNGDYKHWMTTNIDRPVISLLTPRPGLPVFATGMNYEKVLYIKNSHDTNWEQFVYPQTNTEGGKFYVYDTWLGRSGGRPMVKTNVIDDPWVDSDGSIMNGVPKDDEDELRKIYSASRSDSYGRTHTYGADYDGWAEVSMKIPQTSTKLGIPLIDEKKLIQSREWVDHTWVARTCMHNEPLDMLSLTIGKAFVDPTGLVDQVVGTGKDPGDANGMILKYSGGTQADFLNDNVGANPNILNTRAYLSLKDDDVKWNQIRDAWMVGDDINIGVIPIFKAYDRTTASVTTSYTDNKQMGGLKVFEIGTNYFEWMPHAWSLAVGLNKAFWCEFEVPYNPFFSGNDDFRFNKTPVISHFPVNGIKSLLEASPPLEDSKPQLNFYRVERIRDTCGPFGVRSTWIDDPNDKLGKWLIGEYKAGDKYIGDSGDKDNAKKSISRCAGWLDLYKKGVVDPKIISWRLPRFDYEFLKSFLDCTGPIKAVGKSPCKTNYSALQRNNALATCEMKQFALNVLRVAAYVVQNKTTPPSNYTPIECTIIGSACEEDGCHRDNGDKFGIYQKMLDNLLRYADYSTRGDTYYGYQPDIGAVDGTSKSGAANGSGSSGGTDPSGGSGGAGGTTTATGSGTCTSADGSSSGGSSGSSMSSAISQIEPALATADQAINSLAGKAQPYIDTINDLFSSLTDFTSASVSNTQGQLSTALSNATTATNDKVQQAQLLCQNSGLKSELQTVNSKLDAVTAKITQGQGVMNGFVSDVNSFGASISVTVTVAGYTGVATLSSTVQDVLGKANPLTQVTSVVNSAVGNLTSAVTTVQNGIRASIAACSNPSAMSSAEAQQVINSLTTVNSALAPLGAAVGTINTAASTVSTVSSTINSIKSSLNTLESAVQVAKAAGQLDGLVNNVSCIGSVGAGGAAVGAVTGTSGATSNDGGGFNKYAHVDPLYGLEGFRGAQHSTMVQKFWLKKDDGTFLADNEPFGFWCNCPADDPTTTRCREDYCTTEQHVVVVGRKGIYKPIAISTAPGPFGRWLGCYYQARARACPILTREVSDTPAYSTLVDPFPQDKLRIPGVTEASGKGQNFNVCDATKPTGIGEEKMDQFLRWMHEEPNHLARVPLWFESSGGGYRNQDLVFYTQTRDFSPPFMEMAAPFPIDLITRDQTAAKNADGTNNRMANALGEINQREGTYKIGYQNSRIGDTSADATPIPATDEVAISNFYGNGFRSNLLIKHNTTQIQATGADPSSTIYTDSAAYADVYTKYLKGLYAIAKSFKHGYYYKPVGPGAPGAILDPSAEADQRIDPRAEETIVGPRGCDIGGWYEMMLYQARCIKFFALNCICDYDKTFARGSDITYALGEAGMKFRIAHPQPLSFVADQSKEISAIKQMAQISFSSFGLGVADPNSLRSSIVSPIQMDRKGRMIGAARGVEVKVDSERTFPLANRGIVGPEFAKAVDPTSIKKTSNQQFSFKGLNDEKLADGTIRPGVLIGDILIWDESIKDIFDGKAIDAGYQRHVAYVKNVIRNDNATKDVLYIIVSEMNWGKDLDSCGNTDMWNIKTERVIWNPGVKGSSQVMSVYTPVNAVPIAPQPVTTKDALQKYASCQNADWGVCVEKYWSQVTVYRPYKVQVATYSKDEADVTDPDMTHDAGDVKQLTVTPDPDYQNNVCSTSSTTFPKMLTEARIQDIATQNGIKIADIQSYLGDSTLEFNSANIERYVLGKMREGTDVKFEVNTVMYGQEGANPPPALWKVLSHDRASYPYDEVQKFLNNPLFGTLDRCDPPVTNSAGTSGMRGNFDAVRRDAIFKAGAQESAGNPK